MSEEKKGTKQVGFRKTRISIHQNAHISDKKRRKTVFELDSYIPTLKINKLSLVSREEEDIPKTKRAAKFKTSGKVRINLSERTQHLFGCVIGVNLTEEYPWIEISKQAVEDDIFLYPEISDFVGVADEVSSYPGDKLLIGYDPQVKIEEQFYVCLTEESKKKVFREIEAVRSTYELRVRNAIYKVPYEWKPLGSADEIESSTKGTRELLTIQYEIPIKLPVRDMDFTFRECKDQRDGYIEIIPIPTETYENIEKSVIDCAIQNVPFAHENQSQTSVATLVDAAVQYSYSDLPTYKVSEKTLQKNMKIILTHLNDFEIVLSKENHAWDLYANDYQKLISGGNN